jgi:DNA invertase Pin-like site-specific DNA recombinase
MFLRRCAGMTSLISYARVSSADQDPALQLDALHAAGCARVFTDKASGALARRPQLDAALDYARGGDVLVVWRLDRLGRSLRHLVDLVEDMVAREIWLRSLAEGIDTATPGGRMTLYVFGALTEFERQLVAERSRAGVAAAKARGARLGRRPVMTPVRRDTAREMHASGRYTAGEIAATLGVSRATLYRHLPSPTVGARAGR